MKSSERGRNKRVRGSYARMQAEARGNHTRSTEFRLLKRMERTFSGASSRGARRSFYEMFIELRKKNGPPCNHRQRRFSASPPPRKAICSGIAAGFLRKCPLCALNLHREIHMAWKKKLDCKPIKKSI